MEYPTLFTAGTRRFVPWRSASVEDVTVHEAGHQFWYGIVATNEVDHAWMDEGLNTYATARVLDEAFPGRFAAVERYFGGLVPWAYTDARWSRDINGNRLNTYRRAPAWDLPSTPSWRYWPGTAAATTYSKTALWFATLERMLGWDTMQRVLAIYFSRSAFRHPAPDEFFATASEVSGQDLTWFFDAAYRTSSTFDYSVEQVTHQVADGGAIDSTVVVRRLGSGVFPVDIRVVFDDGADVTERWDGQAGWTALRYRRGARVATVEVDPERVLLLDLNYTNNSWTARPRGGDAADRWALRWLVWMQNVLLTYAFVA
jgi:aminopeptidase N